MKKLKQKLSIREKRILSADKWRRKWMRDNPDLWILENTLLTRKLTRRSIVQNMKWDES